jgi:hypothetical protein
VTHRITEEFGRYVDEALDRHGQGEDLHWEVQLAPNDQGGMSLVLVVWMPAGILGDYLVGSIAFHQPPPKIAQEDVDGAVAPFLTGMRGERHKILTTAQNGSGGPVETLPGLILP